MLVARAQAKIHGTINTALQQAGGLVDAKLLGNVVRRPPGDVVNEHDTVGSKGRDGCRDVCSGRACRESWVMAKNHGFQVRPLENSTAGKSVITIAEVL